MPTQHELIDRFLRFKRIALIGVSRNPNDFTRKLWSEFRVRGFEAVPVNPSQHEIDGVRCYPRLQEVEPPVQGALVLVSKSIVHDVLEDCVAARVRTVWLYGIRGRKDVADEVMNYCTANSLDAIAGFCPYMFLPETPFFHRIHRFGWKMIGYYPK